MPLAPAGPNPAQLWPAVRQILAAEHPDRREQIEQLAATACDGGRLVLVTDDASFAAWLNNGSSLGRRVGELLPSNGGKVQVSFELAPKHQPAPAAAPAAAAASRAPGRPSLSPKFTFATFVSGSSNEIAYVAALNLVAEPEADLVSPLYIHGAVGLGKTHLAHACGNEFLKAHPDSKVRVLSGEQFMREVQHAFTSNRIDAFRRRFRELGLLVIDDIQLVGSDSTQTHKQLVALFSYLAEQARPMVITSDRPAGQLKGNLPQRLRSRLEGGVVVTVEAPDFETRIGILKRNARSSFDCELPHDVATILAKGLRRNCRELLGAFKRLMNLARIRKSQPTAEIAHKVVADCGATAVQIRDEEIVKAVCNQDAVLRRDLLGKRRTKRLVQARHKAMYLCRELTDMSLPAIGMQFACHHSSVLHACRKVAADLRTDAHLKQAIEQLSDKLAS